MPHRRAQYLRTALSTGLTFFAPLISSCSGAEPDPLEKAQQALLSSAPTTTTTSTAMVAAPTLCLLGRIFFAGACRTSAWLVETFSSADFQNVSGPTSSTEAAKYPFVVVQEKLTKGWQRVTYTSASVPTWMPKRAGYGVVGKIEFQHGKDADGYQQVKLVAMQPAPRFLGPPFYTWRTQGWETTTYRGSLGTEICRSSGEPCDMIRSDTNVHIDCMDLASAVSDTLEQACVAHADQMSFAAAIPATTVASIACDSIVLQGVQCGATVFNAISAEVSGAGQTVCNQSTVGIREAVRYECEENGCTAPNAFCSGKCIDPSTDPNNCGRCANRCGGMANCINGSCVSVSSDAGTTQPLY